MMLSLKELIVVLAIAGVVFKFAKPIALLFASPDDFTRRRNAWIGVTIAAFLCPSFWSFCLVATPILIVAARKDSNPGALYLMLMYVVPGFSWRVPMVGFSYLVDLDFQLLLSFCVAAPAALRIYRSKPAGPARGLRFVDFCVIAYLVLTSVYFILPEIARGVLMTPTFTDCLRRGFEAFFEVYVPYFLLSRSFSSRRQIQDLFAAFCLACAVMAAVGSFEAARHWLLYGEMRSNWGPEFNPYLKRGDSIRAMASTLHPLVLGYLLAVAFGLWLSLKGNVKSKASRIGGTLLYWSGLLAAYSRGPWMGAAIIYFIFVALSRRAISNLLKAAAASALVAALIAISPIGDKIARVIPYFGGNVDLDNITYRQRLLARALQIIGESPFLGDQYAFSKMEDLRQGGIIDLMNGFVNILLDNGFVGLFFYLSFITIAVVKAWALTRENARAGGELGAMGASLVACILGTMVMMWAGGLIVSTACVLVGLALACSEFNLLQQRAALGARQDSAQPAA